MCGGGRGYGMKRFKAVRDFISCLKDNDVAIFSGKELSKEAYVSDRNGSIYLLDSPALASSLGLGIAMSTNKRVFIFEGDGGFLMELGAAAQITASRCKNITYVIFDNGIYQSAGGQPTIFREMGSIKGFIFGLGFTVFELTSYMTTKKELAKMQKVIDTLKGPTVIIIKVDKGENKKILDIDLDGAHVVRRASEFVQNLDLGTSAFQPPIFAQ
jgi:hypothetical protein